MAITIFISHASEDKDDIARPLAFRTLHNQIRMKMTRMGMVRELDTNPCWIDKEDSSERITTGR